MAIIIVVESAPHYAAILNKFISQVNTIIMSSIFSFVALSFI